MKEYIVDLFPKKSGLSTKTRVFAVNQSAALKLAKEMYPNYRAGAVKPV